ncbi:MAG TPA: hypothetical protein HA257_03705 [Candidatus Methanoperedenaceae archaeon]|nr:hypothetical protein [Candidatus Methanoperedenaceae archaeon]
MIKRVLSGVDGLDSLLDGGFTRPSVIVIEGSAGSGKTTFAIQSLFNAAKNSEEMCMYISAMTEPIAMINNFMSQFSFYSFSLLGQGNVKYVPLSAESVQRGAAAIMNEIEASVEVIKPDRIAIDPINPFSYGLSVMECRKLYYDLFTRLKSWNSLVLVNGELSGSESMKNDVNYLSDGIIRLTDEEERGKRVRYLEILKMRGQKYASGKHVFCITDDGLKVFPKLPASQAARIPRTSVLTGIAELDGMTGGGFMSGSSNLVSGSSGTGKTVLGMQLIVSNARKGVPGVIVCFEDDDAKLRDHMLGFNWDLAELEKKNLLRIVYARDICCANQLVADTVKAIDDIHAGCLLIDSIASFGELLSKYVTLPIIVGSLNSLLRSKNVTTIYTMDTEYTAGAGDDRTASISRYMDAILLLRHVEIDGSLRKAVSVLKMKGKKHENLIREFEITGDGIVIRKKVEKYCTVAGLSLDCAGNFV